MDVTSLYTNNPNQDGIQACEECLGGKKLQGPIYTDSGQTSDTHTQAADKLWYFFLFFPENRR